MRTYKCLCNTSDADTVNIDYYGGTLVSDSFFGLDYYVELKETSSLYNNPEWITIYPKSDILAYEKVAETDNFNIYKNPYALSIGFGVNNSFLTDEYRDKKYLALNDSILSAIANKNVSAFTRSKLNYSVDNNKTKDSDYHATGEFDLEFNVEKEPDGLYYVYLPTYVSDTSRKSWFVSSSAGTVETGGAVLNVSGQTNYKLKYVKDDITFSLHPYLYTLNESTLADAVKAIEGNEFIVDSYTSSKLSGHTESSFDRETLLFTIPYSKYWEVKVDGEKVKTKKVYDAYLAFGMSEGSHDIELIYNPTYLWFGFSISGVALLCLAICYTQYRKNTK